MTVAAADGPCRVRRKRRPPATLVLLLVAALCGGSGAARAQTTTASGVPQLIAAVRAGDAAALRARLAGPIDVNARQPDGATALHWAVHHEDAAIADLLIRAGADVSAANDLGVTPLLLA